MGTRQYLHQAGDSPLSNGRRLIPYEIGSALGRLCYCRTKLITQESNWLALGTLIARFVAAAI
ncbi:MAG: hypothetical protein ACI8X5_003004 [Planctomycetota bacterium]|jgi:hypothetical protein